jgi:hypothetical protein
VLQQLNELCCNSGGTNCPKQSSQFTTATSTKTLYNNYYNRNQSDKLTTKTPYLTTDRAHRATLCTSLLCLPGYKDIAKSLRGVLSRAATGVHQVDGALAQRVGLAELTGGGDGCVELRTKLGLCFIGGSVRQQIRFKSARHSW